MLCLIYLILNFLNILHFEYLKFFGYLEYSNHPSQDSSVGSILARYRGGPGKGENFSMKISEKDCNL